MKRAAKALVLMMFGGAIYMLIELLYRGHTHWTMGLLGGICFVLIGGLNNWLPWEMSILKQMACAAAVVTAAEFLAGLILNVWLGLGIWDYSALPCNILDQVCLPFTGLWCLLSLPAIVADDILRWALFREQFPKYHILRGKNP